MIKSILKWFEKYSIISLIIVVLIGIFIFYISAQTFEKGSPGPEFSLKPFLYHFGIFLLLALFLAIAIIKGKRINKDLLLLTLLIVMGYAITDELHQLFVPNRACDLGDFLTDVSGAAIGSIFYYSMLMMRRER